MDFGPVCYDEWRQPVHGHVQWNHTNIWQTGDQMTKEWPAKDKGMANQWRGKERQRNGKGRKGFSWSFMVNWVDWFTATLWPSVWFWRQNACRREVLEAQQVTTSDKNTSNEAFPHPESATHDPVWIYSQLVCERPWSNVHGQCPTFPSEEPSVSSMAIR